MSRTSASPARRSGYWIAALALTMALAAALPAAASADVGKRIIARCGHGQSLGGFTVAQYKQALKDLEAETEALEYSDCAERIEEAQSDAAGHGGHSGTGTGGGVGGGVGGGTGSGPAGAAGTPVEPTPAQQKVLEQTRREPLAPVHISAGKGQQAVVPGVVHPDLASATSNLPTPVLVVIAMVLAGLALLGAREIRERTAHPRQG